VEVIQAEYLEFDDKIAPDAQRLIGFVVFQLDDVTLSCDSAYLYENNDFKAFNNIHINQGDSIHLYGDDIDYNHVIKTAILTDNVLFNDKDMTLKTNYLNYNLDTSVGNYIGGGTITSTENNNTLVSDQGSYDSESERFFFKQNVILKNPEYTVISDTLQYNSSSETAYFFGPTTITSQDSDIYCQNGWYDTAREICQFSENASITSESRILKGDSLYYNGELKFGEAFRNVSISDSLDKFTISGIYGFHQQEKDSSFVTGKAMYIQDFGKDSLFLHADTLLSVKDTTGQNLIKAFHGVRFFKSDIQGVSDSLIWLNDDSLIQMFYEPIIWNNENQMNADSIQIVMKNGDINELNAHKNAFITSSKGANKYDQIKGRRLIGYFVNNELHKLDMIGNGQAVYYPLQDKDGVKTISGVNKIDCSDITIFMEDSDISRIKFLTKPKGGMLPLNQATKVDEKLEGFLWSEEMRPSGKNDLIPLSKKATPEP